MGYLSCNAESAIATCDPHNWPHFTTKHHNNTRIFKSKSNNSKLLKITEFPYLDLESATNAFSADCFLGKGSHGAVFKAVLDAGKRVVAVKKITAAATSNFNCNNNINNCTSSPAENEIEILSRIRNPRLVNLLGFSVDANDRKLIVVEYMPNGSLYDSLHGSGKPPGWTRRIRFALQIAKAVQHLHSSNPPVIHRDIKSSNILIDGDWNARLGDFGLALRGHVEDVRVKCTPPAGTLGYLDPGYLAPGDLSAKSDVFSFGILLLEMISGRNAIDVNYSPPSVVDWAAPLIRGGDFSKICDPRIGHPADAAMVRRLAVLAARCVRSAAAKRPEMSEVVDCLKAIHRRASSAPIWNHIGRRVKKQSPAMKYEPLDDNSTEIISKSSRMVGSRRNRKVSSVSGVELVTEAAATCNDRVARSKSTGAIREIKPRPSDSSLNGNPTVRRKGGGLGVKMPTVRLSKSRSMGVIQSSRIGHNNGLGIGITIKNPNNAGEMEESKLLVNLDKLVPEKDA